MSLVAVIGEPLRTGGFALAGAMLRPAADATAARAAWRDLPEDVAVVLLTAQAAQWIDTARRDVLVLVLPP